MTDSGMENGTKYEDLAQRVARLEGAVGDGRGYRRRGHPWWMLWAVLWLVFPVMGRFPGFCDFGPPWRMAWPVGVLVVLGVIYLIRDRETQGFRRDRETRETYTGGKR